MFAVFTTAPIAFLSTLPQGERRHDVLHDPVIPVFLSTLPQGERQVKRGDYTYTRLISIHAPARGATVSASKQSILIGISIHAPARGATNDRMDVHYYISISIHAPARGATVRVRPLLFYAANFYPRSRKGSDMSLFRLHCRLILISIHAPARGATPLA